MPVQRPSGGTDLRPAQTPARTVVAGFDGSELAHAALELARRRAGVGGRVVAVYAAPLAPDAIAGAPVPPAVDPADLAERVLGEVPAPAPGEPGMATEARAGPPARALVEVARERDAAEIVVGSHGHGRLRALLGSTSHSLVHGADRPVVVLTQRASSLPSAGGEPAHTIVLGYDGSADARAALAYARRHLAPGGRIVAVHAYHAPGEWLGTPFYQRSLSGRLAEGEELMGEIDDDPAVETELIAGAPAAAIARVAHVRAADEIVVGSRGHGALRAALGSVAHAVLHEADRPVVIVPS